jgi:hypothetical protein
MAGVFGSDRDAVTGGASEQASSAGSPAADDPQAQEHNKGSEHEEHDHRHIGENFTHDSGIAALRVRRLFVLTVSLRRSKKH